MSECARTLTNSLDKSSLLNALFGMINLKKKPALDDRNHTDLYGSHTSAFAMFKNEDDRKAMRVYLMNKQADNDTQTPEGENDDTVTITIE